MITPDTRRYNNPPAVSPPVAAPVYNNNAHNNRRSDVNRNPNTNRPLQEVTKPVIIQPQQPARTPQKTIAPAPVQRIETVRPSVITPLPQPGGNIGPMQIAPRPTNVSPPPAPMKISPTPAPLQQIGRPVVLPTPARLEPAKSVPAVPVPARIEPARITPVPAPITPVQPAKTEPGKDSQNDK